ncbi:hypothetical protein [Bythopirellula goksoeyrii]|uniref:Uncharacterized protein n=1 Tax=Bythopirellula goksoeyrii TaxID=1400387 RepID=A0A5B9Q2Q6_9BACT|nr:hypothetical protein [Bythopirellula goksoeyrii]QEG33307.1 hypothetical protein Pr1d_05680 [Bythopirellula goksoeyrii]
MRQLIFHPLTPLVLFSISLAVLLITYLIAGSIPSPEFEVIVTFDWGLLLALWIVADARRRTGIPCYDFGFICYLSLPFAIPWYCFWSRGWRGALTLILLVGLFASPYFVSCMVWLWLYG